MEQLLHYCWKHKLWPVTGLETTDGRIVEVLDPGLHNRNAGPDFFNAKIKIGGTLWVGNVEIHDRSSHWYQHGHHTDANYDNVVLHIVGEADRDVQTSRGDFVPQVVMAVPETVSNNYEELLKTDSYPPCYRIIPELTKLTIGVNDMTSINLDANTELTTVDVNATSDVPGKLTSLDLSKNTKLTTLKANFNKLESIDLSNNLSLKSIYLLNNGLKSIDFGENTTAKIYISLNNNSLETLDVTKLTGLSNGTLFLMNNNLTELKHNAIKTLNITGNKFDLASLYVVSQNVTTLTSASMQDMEIPETINKTIDLSAQAVINEKPSSIVWKTASGTELVENTDYTVADGVYTFIKEQTEKVYAELKNAEALPKLTTAIKTTQATVIASTTGIRTIAADKAQGVWYNLKGQRVDSAKKGLYIVNGVKVVIK